MLLCVEGAVDQTVDSGRSIGKLSCWKGPSKEWICLRK